MTTRDLQRTDELITAADMAVRVSSQLRLWLKRKSVKDIESVDFGIKFLNDVLNGGNFIGAQDGVAGAANLEPLSWTADLHFGPIVDQSDRPSVNYQDLIKVIDRIRNTLEQIKNNAVDINELEVTKAAKFFRRLGRHLGTKADEALRTPTARFFLSGDRFSAQ